MLGKRLKEIRFPVLGKVVLNCQGAKHDMFLPSFKDYMSVHKPNLDLILEPQVLFLGQVPCNITIVYGRPAASVRFELWEDLRRIIANQTQPWALIGDFNAMLLTQDKRGRAPFCWQSSLPFVDCCRDCDLEDFGFDGPPFTWFWGLLKERLDRGVVNSAWLLSFPNSSITHLHRVKSNHRPLLLRTQSSLTSRLQLPFQFMATWLNHDQFLELLLSSWSNEVSLPSQLSACASSLRIWNRNVFGDIFIRKSNLQKELTRVEGINLSSRSANPLSIELEGKLRNDLEQ
ncbi:hypothetical protein LINPERPRIM_LOCUS14564, partial [Linum perenne]